jgi:hypothetical protein
MTTVDNNHGAFSSRGLPGFHDLQRSVNDEPLSRATTSSEEYRHGKETASQAPSQVSILFRRAFNVCWTWTRLLNGELLVAEWVSDAVVIVESSKLLSVRALEMDAITQGKTRRQGEYHTDIVDDI